MKYAIQINTNTLLPKPFRNLTAQYPSLLSAHLSTHFLYLIFLFLMSLYIYNPTTWPAGLQTPQSLHISLIFLLGFCKFTHTICPQVLTFCLSPCSVSCCRMLFDLRDWDGFKILNIFFHRSLSVNPSTDKAQIKRHMEKFCWPLLFHNVFPHENEARR